jgi:DNA-binding NtrC family response regulator
VRALEAADTIQLLLTDMIMPQGLSGLELAERFQREKANLQVVLGIAFGERVEPVVENSIHFVSPG